MPHEPEQRALPGLTGRLGGVDVGVDARDVEPRVRHGDVVRQAARDGAHLRRDARERQEGVEQEQAVPVGIVQPPRERLPKLIGLRRVDRFLEALLQPGVAEHRAQRPLALVALQVGDAAVGILDDDDGIEVRGQGLGFRGFRRIERRAQADAPATDVDAAEVAQREFQLVELFPGRHQHQAVLRERKSEMRGGFAALGRRDADGA